MQLTVPFYGNTEDNLHCFQASVRMVLKYLLPEHECTWEELEKFTAMRPGKWTWPTKAIMGMNALGLDVVVMEEFDGKAFVQDGNVYLMRFFGEEVGSAQVRMGDIPQEQEFYRQLLASEVEIGGRPEIADIRRQLDRGMPVLCNVNSYALRGKTGYAGHAVVLFGYDDAGFFLHDPGLPPMPDQHVRYDLFRKAWDYPDQTARNLIAVGKRS